MPSRKNEGKYRKVSKTLYHILYTEFIASISSGLMHHLHLHLVPVNIITICVKTSSSKYAAHVRKGSIVQSRLTTSQTHCTCQESSSTERWLSLFT